MNNSIIDKINNSRDGFDTDRPDEKVWNAIQSELHPAEKKKSFPWMKLAAVFIIALGLFWVLSPEKVSENEQVAQLETYVDTFWNEEIDTAGMRKVIRGGSWKNMNHFMQPGQRDFRPFRGNVFKTKEYADNNKSHVGFRNVNTELSRRVSVSQFYLDQTEITNNEYREFVQHVRNQSANSSTVPVATWNFNNVDNGLFVASGSYNVAINDVNACSFTTTTGYNFMHDLNPDFVYVNGNAVLANGRSPYGITDQQEQLEVDHYYEQYDEFEENKFTKTMSESVSTFGIDVDGAGYSNMRRFIESGFMPPKHSIKLEEMLNYFEYKLPKPTGDRPFSVVTEFGKCPWNEKNKLLLVSLKGKEIPQEELPASNLVFLLDVSGSMEDYNKLPLLKQGFKMLIKQLRPQDRVSIVVYAGAAGLVLPSTSGKNKDLINEALMNLNAGGSTAGGEGIELAYKIAEKNFIKGGNNRVILATDGDFNVGVSDDQALVKIIEEKRKTGVFLSVLGFGEGNLQSSKMEKLADNGNGNYSYIDDVLEAKKVLVTQMGGTLHTIAKDVKLQIEFNPRSVDSYRLLGYENRILATEDFDNDLKDAGDLGSGHCVMALYEIVPYGVSEEKNSTKLKYQSSVSFKQDRKLANELMTMKLRYKLPDEDKSKLLTYVISNQPDEKLSMNFYFASAVAEFGMLMRESEYKAEANFESVLKRARNNRGEDKNGYRAEFIRLVEMGQLIFEEYKSSKEKQ